MLAQRFNFPGATVEQPKPTIRVRLGRQYGQEVIHPVCGKAMLFCQIAGTKTLTRLLVKQVKELGYVVEVEKTEPDQL